MQVVDERGERQQHQDMIANDRRSSRTLIAMHRPLSERRFSSFPKRARLWTSLIASGMGTEGHTSERRLLTSSNISFRFHLE